MRMQKREVTSLFQCTNKLASLFTSIYDALIVRRRNNALWSLRDSILYLFQQFQYAIVAILNNLHIQQNENEERYKLETDQYIALKQQILLLQTKCLQLEAKLKLSNDRCKFEHEKYVKLVNDLSLANQK